MTCDFDEEFTSNDELKSTVKWLLGFTIFCTLLLYVSPLTEEDNDSLTLLGLYYVLGGLALTWIVCKIKSLLKWLRSYFS